MLNLSILSCLSLFFVFITRTAALKPDAENRVVSISVLGVCPFFCGLDSNGLPRGVDMDIFKIIVQKLNYSIRFVPSNSYSTVNNGSVTGPVGKVVDGSAEVAMGHIAINYMFQSIADFSFPLYASKYVLMTTKPETLPKYMNLLKPFTLNVWILILVSTFCALMLQVVLARKKSLGFGQQLLHSWLLVAGMVLQQSQNWEYRQSKAKLIFISFWLFFATIIWHGYECLVQASLISVDYEPPINSAADILARNAPFYFVRNRALNDLMKTSTNVAHREVMEMAEREGTELKMPPGGSFSRQVLCPLKQHRGIVVVTETIFPPFVQEARIYFTHNPFRLGSEVLFVSHLGFAYRKNSTLTDEFDQIIPYLVSNGIVEKAFTRNSPLILTADSKNTEDNNDVPLALEHFAFGFFILPLGLMIAGIIFLLEVRP